MLPLEYPVEIAVDQKKKKKEKTENAKIDLFTYLLPASLPDPK